VYIDIYVQAHILAAKALLEGKEGVAGEGILISDGVSVPLRPGATSPAPDTRVHRSTTPLNHPGKKTKNLRFFQRAQKILKTSRNTILKSVITNIYFIF
jgi:hypothetical protein